MIRRLSLLDLAFFVLETADRPMNVGPLIVLAPPTRQTGRAFADALYRRMMKRPAGSPFNLKLRPPSPTTLPALVPDTDFDLARHVHRITLPKPGSMDALLARICALHPQLLDRSRALWDLYVIDGLEDGRVAVYARMHHGVIDGAGLVKVISRWLSDSPKDRSVRAMWEGVEGAASVRHGAETLAQRAGKLLRMGTKTAGTALSFGQLLWQQGMATLDAGPGTPLPFVTTPRVLTAEPSPHRAFAHCTLPLPELKALGKSRDATINDMFLTVLDLALTRYLEHNGAAPAKPLVADMPVALEAGKSGGNRIAMVQIPLGAPGRAPVERLDAIKARTRDIKGSLRGGLADAAMLHTVIAHGLPGLWEGLRLRNAPPLANLVVSNPFGFASKRYLMGAEIELMLPISAVAPGQVLNITAVNYEDRFQIGFIAIAEGVPDIGLLARYTEEAFATLAADLHGKPRKRRPAARPGKQPRKSA